MTEDARSVPGPSLGTVGIIGAGQVGTMLGCALVDAGTEAGVDEVRLFDRDASIARESLSRGAGHRVLTRRLEALEADTVILAAPIPAIVELIDELGPALRPGTALIDTGSAKRVVVDAMRRSVPEGVHAIGGHPMAGTERPGPAGARREALWDATFALTPCRPDPEALARGLALARAVGASPLEIDAESHDRVVARTSHLPHVMAFALASIDLQDQGEVTPRLTSTGYLSATRLARSHPDMVAGFLSANSTEVRGALDELIDALVRIGAALEQGPDVLGELLSRHS